LIVTGNLLYYGQAVDPTNLAALNNPPKPPIITSKACNQLLDYLATHPNAII